MRRNQMGNSNEGIQWLEGYQKWVEVVIIYWGSSVDEGGQYGTGFCNYNQWWRETKGYREDIEGKLMLGLRQVRLDLSVCRR